MKASDTLSKRVVLDRRALTRPVDLSRAIDRVTQKWPDAIRTPQDNDREKLAQEMLQRVRSWNWSDLKTSRVTSAALAVFDKDRRDRNDLEPVRRFFFDEIRTRQPSAFLDAMVWVYIETFISDERHTRSLAAALTERRNSFGARIAGLVNRFPNLFEPSKAPTAVGQLMVEAEDAYVALRDLGFRSPHASGLTQAAHQVFVREIAGDLDKKSRREQLFNWLAPEAGNVLQTGAGMAVEALLEPWIETVPPDDVRDEISETIIDAYNDPRLHRGGIWTGFDPDLKSILLRWLTKQDMKFFCDMVTATQNSHMWPPRRDFWLDLYDDGMIEEAWVAFGSSARQYAQRLVKRSGDADLGRRFGRQHDRGGSTSLLIMRIGNKIVVDGCHSYRTHIFNRDDPNAPKLYRFDYYCDDIMRSSRNAKPHNSIPNWKGWVMRHV